MKLLEFQVIQANWLERYRGYDLDPEAGFELTDWQITYFHSQAVGKVTSSLQQVTFAFTALSPDENLRFARVGSHLPDKIHRQLITATDKVIEGVMLSRFK
jgi:hypothetical protein